MIEIVQRQVAMIEAVTPKASRTEIGEVSVEDPVDCHDAGSSSVCAAQ